jgi:hypothetical protein
MGQYSAFGKRKRMSVFNRFDETRQKITVGMVQKYFIDSWLLLCLLLSYRTANPRRIMGFAIFRLYQSTIPIQQWQDIEI